MSDIADQGARADRAAVDQELAALDERGQAVVVLAGGGDRVLWATATGAALFGFRDPAELTAAVLDPRSFPVERFAELARGAAPESGARLERLRLTVGRRIELATFACRRATLADGEPVLVAIAMNGPVRAAGWRAPRSALTPPAFARVPAPAGVQAPARVDAAALRARFGGRSLARFTWRTDGQHRLEDISADFARAVGDAHAPKAGDDFGALDRHGVEGGCADFAAALGRGQTFTGVDVIWPVAGADREGVVVALSGVPTFDRDRGFMGYRGFGVIHLDTLAPLSAPPAEPAAAPASMDEAAAPVETPPPAIAPAEAPRDILSLTGPAADNAAARSVEDPPAPPVEAAPEKDAADEAQKGAAPAVEGDPGQDDAPAPPPPAPEASHAAPRPPRTAPMPFVVSGSAHATLGTGKVVPLRTGIVRAPDPALGAPGLSRSERHAFREIARALGARVEGDETQTQEPEPLPASPPVGAVATPAAPEPDDEAVIDSSGPEPTSAEMAAHEHEAALAADAALPAPEPDEPDLFAAAEPESAALVEPPRADPAPSGPELSDLARNAETIFDRIPVGILVSRGDVPIVMNRTLLDVLGYEDIDAFHAEGGMSKLFLGRPADSLATLPEGSAVVLATREGEGVEVDARLQSIVWDGLPATLMSFRRAIDGAALPKVKAMELDLKRRMGEARELRAILDTATDGVIVIDEAGRVLSLNRAGEALFGYDQNEVAGETFITLFAPDSHALALDYLEGLKANGVASVLNDGREVVGRVRQGGRIPLFMTLGAISDLPDRKFCAVLRDITPWKKAESDLLEAKRAAEHASAQKSDFLAKISHEVRTPLSAIIGFAEVMIEERFGPIGNERYLEYLRDIHASGGHVISLVNDLLDLSKIEAGRFDLNFISVDANEIVSRSVAMMQPQAGAGRVVLRTSLSQRLPHVVADERSLRQIVLNILSNAVKFTDPGGQVIVSTAFTDRGEVALRVRDTGIGMTEKEIETALEPFRQVSTARRAGGTGLGLPLTKALVEANRAALTIRSEKDSGTLVEVTFPTTRVLSE
ncbi:ATP-binding protein [Alsobacter sp. KACC 23698]|uniref:histidine kinase n=1 Tax=Alsobacter sp. KACC 23698 TaxID=3149229 RepID=A0AAU7JI32_9HYPH